MIIEIRDENLNSMFFSGVRPNGPGAEAEGEPVCEECSQAKNSLHCIDASIQVNLISVREGVKITHNFSNEVLKILKNRSICICPIITTI